MSNEIIHKPEGVAVHANLLDGERERAKFGWEVAKTWLDYLPGGGLNIGYEAVDRHVAHGRGGKEAIRWLSRGGQVQSLSYADLKRETDRFALLLGQLGLKKGDRVFSLLGRIPELYITALGTLKAGCVFCPLYAAFGPEPVRARMTIGEANLLVTSAADYRKKVEPWRSELASLQHVLLVDRAEDSPPNVEDFQTGLAEQKGKFSIAQTRSEDMALLHFTSGTTGTPKGAIHVHEAVVAHNATGRLVLDLHEDDVFWCTADPGWVTGTSYGIIAPLTNGVTMLVDEGEFEAERWYAILAREKVTVWYTAPTAIRLLMKAGDDLPKKHDLSRLRFMASVGEPLNAEAVLWSQRVLGRPFHDNWWQTETGGIMIANTAAMDVKLGSMGKPLPGVEAAIVETEGDTVTVATAPQSVGQLALKPGWPSMFRGYLHEEARYAACFKGGWYLTAITGSSDAPTMSSNRRAI
jgi:acetyl-CoA synthetase